MSALCALFVNFDVSKLLIIGGWLAGFIQPVPIRLLLLFLAFRQASNADSVLVITLLFVAMPLYLCLHVARLLFASHGGLSGVMCAPVERCV